MKVSYSSNEVVFLDCLDQDCEDSNPLIRALAVRTMGCIRVDKIIDYLCQPLRNCLKDEDPYVRKTAAVCVAKLHDINAQLVEDQGFLDQLRDLLSDSNPMVCLSISVHCNSLQLYFSARCCFFPKFGSIISRAKKLRNRLL